MKITVILLYCAVSVVLGFEDKTIVEWLETNPGFTTLLTAIKAAGLTSTLSAPGPFTLLAPTDDAFSKLGTDNINSLLNNTDQLAWILKFHVLPEFLVIPMVTSASTKQTLSIGTISIAPNNGGLIINNYSNVSNVKNDIIVNNGVIQPISNVLVPQALPTFTISQYLIEHDSEFIDVTLALFLANLTSTLDYSTDTFTMFAPVDDAFGVYKNNILSPTQPNALRLYQEVLKNHVVSGLYMARQLKDGQILTTLHGKTVTVKVSSSGVKLNNNVTIIDTDMVCTNGVIHAIDAILIPEDVYQLAQG